MLKVPSLSCLIEHALHGSRLSAQPKIAPLKNNPCVAVWQSLAHADRGRRLFTESEWHDDVNNYCAALAWGVGSRACEHSKAIPGMDLGGCYGDLGMSMRSGVHVYACSGRMVNLSCFYRGLFSRYVGVDCHCNQTSVGKRLEVDTAPGRTLAVLPSTWKCSCILRASPGAPLLSCLDAAIVLSHCRIW